jgi:asparagine synthase (glutamine-hydrolysing)
MCGINGIFGYRAFSDEIRADELVAAREAMRSRGPDGKGEWWSADRRCGLGHRRLSVIDLSGRAAQPMTSEDGHFVIVFNGEIYNYRALKGELEAQGVRFRTGSDTEVLLHLFAREGAAFVPRLRGMFAFAIWDERGPRMLLARDTYGIKPLYTSDDGRVFRFASQVKALVAGGVSREPDAAGWVGFHLFGSVPEPFTIYRHICALPAGHTQWIDSGGPRPPVPFASIASVVASVAASPVAVDDLNARVRTAVHDSVRAHLVADVEVGLFLSAGVDSGSLLGLMRDAGQARVRALTVSFDAFSGTGDDEAPLAAVVAHHYGAEHCVRRVGREEFERDLPAILAAMDQPSIDGVNTWFVAKAAQEAGLKVALSGLGGDELLAGYPSFADLPRWRRRCGLLARVPGLGAMLRRTLLALAPGLAQTHPKALGLIEHASSWAGAYLVRRGIYLPHELRELMDPAVAAEGLHRLAPLARLSETLMPDPGSDIGRVTVLESTHYMRNQLLRDADWAGMAHGIEIRVPLVDMTVLDAIAPCLPRLRRGAGKLALAAAPSRPLPKAVIARAKTGFAVPTGAWLRSAPTTSAPSERKGLAARRWSRRISDAFALEPGCGPPWSGPPATLRGPAGQAA